MPPVEGRARMSGHLPRSEHRVYGREGFRRLPSPTPAENLDAAARRLMEARELSTDPADPEFFGNYRAALLAAVDQLAPREPAPRPRLFGRPYWVCLGVPFQVVMVVYAAWEWGLHGAILGTLIEAALATTMLGYVLSRPR